MKKKTTIPKCLRATNCSSRPAETPALCAYCLSRGYEYFTENQHLIMQKYIAGTAQSTKQKTLDLLRSGDSVCEIIGSLNETNELNHIPAQERIQVVCQIIADNIKPVKFFTLNQRVAEQ